MDATREVQSNRKSKTMPHQTVIIAEPGQKTLVIKRTFDAPARLVYRAMTEAEHMFQWYGPRSCPLIKCEIDLRVGGKYRWGFDAGGQYHEFTGEFRELVPGKRIVYTQVYAMFPDATALVTTDLVEDDGKTHLTATVLHEEVAHRDAHVASGMEYGLRESYERMDELLATLR